MVEDPVTGRAIGTEPDDGAEEAERAIVAAHRAFATWRRRSAADRAAILRRWTALMYAHRADLARLVTPEQGKPIEEAAGEVDYAASSPDWFAEEARRIDGELLQPDRSDRRLIAGFILSASSPR